METSPPTGGAHVCNIIAFRGLKWVARRLWTDDSHLGRRLEDNLRTCGRSSVRGRPDALASSAQSPRPPFVPVPHRARDDNATPWPRQTPSQYGAQIRRATSYGLLATHSWQGEQRSPAQQPKKTTKSPGIERLAHPIAHRPSAAQQPKRTTQALGLSSAPTAGSVLAWTWVIQVVMMFHSITAEDHKKVNTLARKNQIRSTIFDKRYIHTPRTCGTEQENEEEGLSAEDSTFLKHGAMLRIGFDIPV
jgi:hypothetical protein